METDYGDNIYTLVTAGVLIGVILAVELYFIYGEAKEIREHLEAARFEIRAVESAILQKR